MPRRVAELGNGVCRAQVELDVGLDCQLALLCAVHAVLCVTFSWSRFTTAVPNLNLGLTKHNLTQLNTPGRLTPHEACRKAHCLAVCGDWGPPQYDELRKYAFNYKVRRPEKKGM